MFTRPCNSESFRTLVNTGINVFKIQTKTSPVMMEKGVDKLQIDYKRLIYCLLKFRALSGLRRRNYFLRLQHNQYQRIMPGAVAEKG